MKGITKFMKHKYAIYTIIHYNDHLISFPYPPIYQENDTDYLCFTNNKTITSKYWKIYCLPDLNQFTINNILSSYENCKQILPNQIPIDSLFQKYPEYETLITIPRLHDIPGVFFDENTIVPTKDKYNRYLYTKNPIYTGGPYHGRSLLLSIGVPVSNQIETIELCLSHIKPLLEQLDSELLVIDTGSTDGTLDICNNYGARIINFPWCNNMSAVRNTGIYHSLGEWYLSIDDDEWFESVDEIIDFFKTGNYLNYNAATYIQRNYETSSGETWSDLPALRIAKITPELHFEGRIHDSLITKGGELCQIPAYVHHYGFVKDQADKKAAKYIRNVSYLLYDIFEYPEHLRHNYQLAAELNLNRFYKEACAYFIRGMSIEKEKNDNFYGKNHAVHLLATLYNIKDSRLFQMAKLIETSYPYLTPAEKAFIHYLQADLGLRMGKSPDILLKHYYNYQAYRLQFDKNPSDNFLYSDIGLKVCTDIRYITDIYTIALYAYIQLNDIFHALDILSNIIPENILFMKTTFISSILTADNEIYTSGFQKLSPVQIKLWASELLYYLLESLNKKEIQSRQLLRLSSFLTNLNVDTINQFFSYYKIKLTISIQNILCKNAMESNVADMSYQELFFYVSLLRYRFKSAPKTSINIYFFTKYTYLLGIFSALYYQPELLKQIDCTIIPNDILASYYIYLAIESKKELSVAINHFKTALHIFPEFQTEIQILLKEINQSK